MSNKLVEKINQMEGNSSGHKSNPLVDKINQSGATPSTPQSISYADYKSRYDAVMNSTPKKRAAVITAPTLTKAQNALTSAQKTYDDALANYKATRWNIGEIFGGHTNRNALTDARKALNSAQEDVDYIQSGRYLEDIKRAQAGEAWYNQQSGTRRDIAAAAQQQSDDLYNRYLGLLREQQANDYSGWATDELTAANMEKYGASDKERYQRLIQGAYGEYRDAAANTAAANRHKWDDINVNDPHNQTRIQSGLDAWQSTDYYGKKVGDYETKADYLRASMAYAEPTEQWSDEERKKFGFLYATSPDTAHEYGLEINNKYNKAQLSEEQATHEAKIQTDSGLAKIFDTAAGVGEQVIGGVPEYLTLAGEYLNRGTITQRDHMSMAERGEQTIGTIANQLNDIGTIDESVPVLGGKGLGDAYQVLTSMLQSTMSIAAGGEVGSLTSFFGSAAASGIRNALDNGATSTQAMAIGTMAGAAEVLTELVGVENLIDNVATGYGKQAILQILKQAGIEASEEAASDVLNTAVDILVMGDRNELQQKINEYISQGMDPGEARQKAFTDWIQDTAFDALTGGLSGGLSAMGKTVINSVAQRASSYEGDFTKTQQLADVLGDEGLRNRAGNVAAKLEKGQRVSSYEANRLGWEITQAIEKGDKATFRTAVENRLKDLGQTVDVKQAADAITTLTFSEGLNERKIKAADKAIENNQLAQMVYSELAAQAGGMDLRGRQLDGMYTHDTSWVQNMGTKVFGGSAYGSELSKAETARFKQAKTKDGEDISLNMQSTGTDSGAVYNSESGKIEFRNGDKVLSQEELELTPTQSHAIDVLQRELGADSATAFNMMRGDQDVVSYAREWKMYRNTYGKTGVKWEWLKDNRPSSRLSAEQVEAAFLQGHAEYEQNHKEAPKPEQRKSTAKGKVRTGEFKVEITENGKKKSVTYKAADMKKIRGNEQLRSMWELCRNLSKIGMLDFVFYEGERGAGANGMFSDGTDTIYINVNAMSRGANALGQTLSHELTHWIQANNAEMYDKLKAYVQENIVRKDSQFYADRMSTLMNSQGLSEEAALDEIVANACETMLFDSKVVQELAEKEPGLYNTIRNWLRKFVQRLRDIYGGEAKALHYEAKILQGCTELQKIWDLGFSGAVANVQRAKESGKKKENAAKSNGKNSMAEDEPKSFSYKALTDRGEIKGWLIKNSPTVPMNTDGSIDEKQLINYINQRAQSDLKASGTFYLNCPEIGRNVKLVTKPLRHGFFKNKVGRTATQNEVLNAKATMLLPEILENSIEVNRNYRDEGGGVDYSHILLSVIGITDSNGIDEFYAVRTVIQERINESPILTELNVLGRLSAVNIKKLANPRSKVTNNATLVPGLPIEYNIAELIDDVKDIYDDTFSNDVYRHFGLTRNKTKNGGHFEIGLGRVEDQRYRDAIAKGDTATARRMLDQAAAGEGYTKRRYHQTNSVFHVFDLSRNTNSAADKQTPFGIFTKRTKADIGLGKYQMDLYVKAEKTLEVNDRDAIAKSMPQAYTDLMDKISKLSENFDARAEELEDALFEAEDAYQEKHPEAEMTTEMIAKGDTFDDPACIEAKQAYDEHMASWNSEEAKLINEARQQITDWLRNNGYDSMEIHYDKGTQGRSTDALIVLDNTQVKSADLVTYDDNGNEIPLSERFNTGKDDIRFSMAEKEAMTSKDLRELEENQIRLRDQRDYLKKQFDRWSEFTDRAQARRFIKSDLDKLLNQLIEQTGYKANSSKLKPMNREELERRLESYANWVIDNRSKWHADTGGEDAYKWTDKAIAMAKPLIQDMMENAYAKPEDPLKEIRDYTKNWMNRTVRVSDKEWADLGTTFADRVSNYPGMRLSNSKGYKLDELYEDLHEMYPGRYPELTSQSAMLDAIKAVLQSEPEVINQNLEQSDTEYDMAVETLAMNLVMQLSSIREKQMTEESQKVLIAKLRGELKRSETANKKLMEILAADEAAYNAAIDVIRGTKEADAKVARNYMGQIQKLRSEMLSAEAEANSNNAMMLGRLSDLQQRYVTDQELDAYYKIKKNSRSKEYKEWADQEITRLKKLNYEQRHRTSENRKKTEMRNKIKRLVNDMNHRLLNPTKNKYIPAKFIKQVVEMLQMIDTDTGKSQNVAAKLAKIRAAYSALEQDEMYKGITADPIVGTRLQQLADMAAELPENATIYSLNYEQLEFMYNVLSSTEHYIRKAVKVTIDGEEREAYLVSKELTNETRGASKVKASLVDSWIDTQLSPERMFERLGGFKKNSTWEKVYRMLNDGQLKATQIMMESSMFFADLIDEDKGKRYMALTRYDKNNLVKFGLRDEDGNEIAVTRGMMLSIYMHLQNEDNAKHVARGGLTIPNMKEYYGGKGGFGAGTVRAVGVSAEMSEASKVLREAEEHGTEAEIKAAREEVNRIAAKGDDYVYELRTKIEKEMTDYDRRFIKAAQKFFDGYSKNMLNKTTMDIYGFKKANVTNYFPIQTDKNFLDTPFETVARDFSLENSGNMKDRQKSSAPILALDITKVVDRQINFVAKYCGIMPAVKQFNMIFGKTQTGWSDSLKNAISDMHGEAGARYVENLISDLNGVNRGEKSVLGLDKWLDTLRGNMAQASLTLSLRTAMGQAASYPTAAAVVGWKALGKALAHGGKGNTVISRADQELIRKYSPLLWYRMQGYSTPEMGDLEQSNSQMSKLWRKARWATGWIQAMDGATVGRLWYAAQYYVEEQKPNLKKGSEEYYQEVAKVFNDVVEKTQPNYTVLQRPDILRSQNALVKQLTMFLTQRLQNFNIMFEASARYKQYSADFKAGRNEVTAEDVKQARKAVGTAFASQIAAAVTITAFKYMADIILHSMNAYRDDDDELTKESKAMALLDAFIDSLTGNVLGGGEIYDIVEKYAFGGTYYGIEANSLSTINDMVSSVTSFAELCFEKPETEKDQEKHDANLKKAAEKLAKQMGQLAGMPANNAIKIVNGIRYHIEDMANGEFGSMEAGVNRTMSQETHRLYNAIVSGDSEKAQKIIDGVEDKEKLNQDLVSYIGKQYVEKHDLQKQDVIKLLVDNCDYLKREAEDKVQKWTCEVVTGIKYTEIKDKYLDGTITGSRAAEMLKTYGGYSQDDAKKKVLIYQCEKDTGIAYDDIKEELLHGRLTTQKAAQMWQKYGGNDADYAIARAEYAVFLDKNPNTTLSQSQYQKWYEDIKSTGITTTVFEQFKLGEADCHGEDKNGDGKTDSGSKKKQVVAVIDSLPLTPEQKDALYFAAGYGASTLKKSAPWR